MKKIVILNGSPHKTGNTMALVNEVSKSMENKETEIKTYNLNTMQISCCQGCNACKKAGKCAIKDDMQLIYEDINDADGIIFATPIYIYQMSAQLKIVIDRLVAYMKEDHSSYLSPNKKVLFVSTFGGGIISQYQDYFDMTGKSLVFLGFGEYKTLITGGLREPKELLERSKVLLEAKNMGEWLLNY
ncbi:flavodoxin family protein [Clostridium sp. BL-8]|uniref:flavodoxin family protein n=1 Tax=Clostridium sp. BL-8 TaxID=349938 RepID=UPI00098C4F8B|nr:flavodoxin family protein [Clostridium sp. BL-8]OOM68307.1 iron-sulfur flavoprotein [Clostridium sp. BL-8]